MTMGETSPT